jgi:GxxExxY protein
VRIDLTDDDLTGIIVGSAIDVHRPFGPGLFEHVYQRCLVYKLVVGHVLFVEVEKRLPVKFEDVEIECGYKVDLLVERRILVEVKAIDALRPIDLAQMMTYLRLSGCRLGLILNFNVKWMKAGIRRVVWDPPPGDADGSGSEGS